MKLSTPDKVPVAEAAKYLGLSVHFLNSMRTNRKGPCYFKFANRVYYIKADLDSFQATRKARQKAIADKAKANAKAKADRAKARAKAKAKAKAKPAARKRREAA